MTCGLNNRDFAISILDDLPDAVLIIDKNSNLVLVNHQAELLFGYSRSELVGGPLNVLIPERLRVAHSAHTQDYFARPRLRPMGAPGLTLVAQCKDGAEIKVEISLSPMTIINEIYGLAIVRKKNYSIDTLIEKIAVAASHKIISEQSK